MSRFLAPLMAFATRRPLLVVLLSGALGLAGGAFALATLEAQTSPDTLVGRGTSEYKTSAAYAERFGDNAVYVLVRQPATQTALTNDLVRLIGLEGCLSGAPPRGEGPIGGPGGPCASLVRMKPAKVVFGPGTFINTSVGQIQDEFTRQTSAAQQRAAQAAEAARRQARRQGRSKASRSRRRARRARR
jgi:hypothetical protein